MSDSGGKGVVQADYGTATTLNSETLAFGIQDCPWVACPAESWSIRAARGLLT